MPGAQWIRFSESARKRARNSFWQLRAFRHEGVLRFFFVDRVLRLLASHVIVSSRSRIGGGKPAHAANVCSDFPNLVIGDVPPERWHAIRPPFHDRGKDLLRL